MVNDKTNSDGRRARDKFLRLKKMHSGFKQLFIGGAEFLWSAEADIENRTVNYLYISPVFELLSGCSIDSFTGGKTGEELILPEDHDAWTDFLLSLLEMDLKDLQNEYQLQTPDGRNRWLQDNIIINEISKNRFRMESIVTDISYRKQIEQELTASNINLNAIADYTYDWENWICPNGELRWVNPAVERITGYSKCECMKMKNFPHKLIYHEDKDKFTKLFQHALNQGSGSDAEFRIVRKNNEIIWVSISYQPIFDSHDQCLGHRSSIHNIQQRKNFEAQLQDRAAFFMNNPSPSFHTGESGIILEYNPAVRKLIGSQLEGKMIYDILPGFTKKDLDKTTVKKPNQVETLLDNKVFLFTIRKFPKTNSYYFYGSDITAPKRMEMLHQDMERITRHDLKTPLSTIINVPTLMRELMGSKLDETQEDLLALIEKAGRQMINTVNHSLDIYKMEQGIYELKPSPIDLLPVIKTVCQNLENLVRQQQLSFSINIDGKTASSNNEFIIYSEEFLSYSLLANLVKNAVEKSPKGGEIKIDLHSGDPVQIIIRNQGEVVKEIRANFFDKYVTSGKIGGTGLGTYSAKLIAEAHAGNISMKTGRNHTAINITIPVEKLKKISSVK